MNKSLVRFISETAMGIALVILAQLLGKSIPAGAVIVGPLSVTQLITGSLVNCVLFVFAYRVGALSGVLIGLLSSLLAFTLGIGPALFPVVPVVGLGNAILALLFALLVSKTKLPRSADMVISALTKCAFLWVCVPAVLKMLGTVPAKQITVMSAMFSWPQGVTALIGGLLALLIIPRLAKIKAN